MDFKQAVRQSLVAADFLVDRYLSDMTPQELLMRAVPDANHIAWQLGHLIVSEWQLVEAAVPGSMPALPDGFAERHTKEIAAIDDPQAFLSKDAYLDLARQVRAGTLAALEKLPDVDTDKPVGGRVPPFIKRAGDCFLLIGGHWGTHAGQWVVLRRKLGRARQF